MIFYFFKVTLSYFDDEQKTFFITPDQSKTDDEGIPFSENDLRNTSEFKDFVKKTKADVIDVDYTEFAIEFDAKNSDAFDNPITSEIFDEFNNRGLLEIVDENQFPIILKRAKSSSTSVGGSKLHIVCLIAAAVLVLGIFGARAKKDSSTESEMPDLSDVSAITETSTENGSEVDINSEDVPESNSENVSENSSEESSETVLESVSSTVTSSNAGNSASTSSDSSSKNSSVTSSTSENGGNSSANSENTHEVTSNTSTTGGRNESSEVSVVSSTRSESPSTN